MDVVTGNLFLLTMLLVRLKAFVILWKELSSRLNYIDT